MILDFAALALTVFALSVGVFLTLGTAIEAVNRRCPERRIQAREARIARREAMIDSVGELAVTSTCIAAGLFAQAHGWTPAPLAPSGWSVPLTALAGILMLDCWFYFMHRALHTRWLYRFHRPHHRHVAPTVWANDAGSPVDTALTHGFYALLPFVLPIPVFGLVLLRLFDQVTAMIGHCGHEYFAGRMARWPWPGICTLYHDQHHSAFRYNYGNCFSFWDRGMGTLHPRYDEAVADWEARSQAEIRPAEAG